jgi:hypothetical protein
MPKDIRKPPVIPASAGIYYLEWIACRIKILFRNISG